MANQSLRYWLTDKFSSCGASGYTVTECNEVGRRHLAADSIESAGPDAEEYIWIELIVPDNVCDTIIKFLRRRSLQTPTSLLVSNQSTSSELDTSLPSITSRI
jgi:hypothetical protein